MSDKLIKGILNAYKTEEDIEEVSVFHKLLNKAKMTGDYYDDYYNKGLKATKEDESITIDKAKRINPLYEDRQKWAEEEKEEREKEEYKKQQFEKLDKYFGEKLKDVKERFKLNNNTYEDILYKKSSDITESEIDSAKKYSWYESKDKELNTKLDNKISDWYDNFYGKKPSADATGRTVRPEIRTPFLTEPKSLKTPDGMDIKTAFSKVAETTSKSDKGAYTLQGALNGYDFEPKLKEDGDIGPKTTSRTKEGLMNYGVKDVVDRIERQEQKSAKYIEEKEERDLDGNVVV